MRNSTKQMYKYAQGKKVITMSFPEIGRSYTTENLDKDQVSLNEALMNGDNIEFVGCISSYFQAKVHDASADLKNKRIIVTMDIDGENDPITIFRGYVDSAKTRSDLAYKEIVCYDDLQRKAADKDVAAWYRSLALPMTIKQIRNSLFAYIGITQKEANLPNDNIVIQRQYDPKLLNALDVIKNVCQVSGACGIMNRDGLFEYRFPMGGDVWYAPYPSNHTYPSAFYPGGMPDLVVENFFYKSMQYEEYLTNKITRVEVRDDNKSPSYGYGNGTNKYILQGNIFVYGLDDATKVRVAQNIYNKVKNFQYRPVSYEAPGLPFAEVGSVQSFYVMDWLNGSGEKVKRSFPLLNRTLSGMQELVDKCQVRGKEDQTEFVSSLNTRVDLIERSMDNYYTKDDIDSMLDDYWTADETAFEVGEITDEAISQMETPTGFNIVSCYTLPSNRTASTLYCVKGGIIIL